VTVATGATANVDIVFEVE